MNDSELARFHAQHLPEPNSGCWLWIGATDTCGYGRIRISGKQISAHRASFIHSRGGIPEGTEIDHTCTIRACVNPVHLEPVTHRINVLRGKGPSANCARRERCEQGHPLTLNASGIRRKCLECSRLYQRLYMREWRSARR